MRNHVVILSILLFLSSFSFAEDSADLADGSFYVPIYFGLDGSIKYTVGIGGHEVRGHNDMSGYGTFAKGLGFMPLVYGGIGKFSRTVNLGNSEYGPSDNVLQKNNDQNNSYKIAKSRGIGIGPGFGIGFAPGNWGILGGEVSFGIIPKIGGSVYTERVVPNKLAIRSLKNLSIPKNLQELDLWNVGDSMSYSAFGGINISGGVASTIFASAGLNYSAEGNWNVSLKKVGEDQLIAMITKGKSSSFGAGGGTTFTGLSTGIFKNRDKNFTFLFDFQEPEAVIAFKQMIRGKLTTAQELSLQSHGGVKWIKRVTNLVKGGVIELSGGIPFLAKGVRSWGKMHTLSKTYEMEEKKIISHMTVVSDEMKTSGVASSNKARLFHFFGNHQTYKSDTSKEHFAGTFKWVYQNDRLKGKKLKNEIEKLIKKFGFANDLRIDIPEEKLGFVTASFEININQEGLENLLSKDISSFSKRALYRNIDQVLLNEKDRKIFCKTKTFLNTCKKILKRRSAKALRKAQKHLKRMKWLLNSYVPRKFTRELALFGREMMKNRFVFQSLLREVGEESLKVKLSIQGENILPFEKNISN
ncbi:MAG: hypothetical protein VYD54_12445 [Bdellovibrionota bacterium]|nr:hypothetical protein [Bdellovibrionota bacterium]